MTQEALKLALEALENAEYGDYDKEELNQAIAVIKKALAQPEQEPVIDKSAAIRIATSLGWEPKRTWVGLTDEDCKGMSAGYKVIAMWADRTLKEKNNGI